MNDPDHFLARWSRRKSVAGKAPADKISAKVPASSDSAAVVESTAPAPLPQGSAGAAPQPAFDPASLPSLDSIGADTDISAFLKPGVPGHLRHAALRRAWSADPAIRDFKGLQENDWNFNDPNGIPGFGELSPNTDVKKMLGQLFGDSPDETGPADEQTSMSAQKISTNDEAGSPRENLAREAGSVPGDESHPIADEKSGNRVQFVENIAAQENDGPHADSPVPRRRSHGGAVPE